MATKEKGATLKFALRVEGGVCEGLDMVDLDGRMDGCAERKVLASAALSEV